MPTRRDGTVPILAHGAIYLRAAERADVPLFVSWLNDLRTSRTLTMRSPMSQPMEEAWFERAVTEQGKSGYHFVACLLADDRPIGTVGLFELDLLNGNAGLGLSIGAPDDTGKGYGTDMILALLAFSFDGLRLERVWLDCYDFNEGAHRLYQRLGFVDEGRARRAIFREGRYADLFRMSMLKSEWLERYGAEGADNRRDPA